MLRETQQALVGLDGSWATPTSPGTPDVNRPSSANHAIPFAPTLPMGMSASSMMQLPLMHPGLPTMLPVGPNGTHPYVLPPHLGDPTHAAIFVAAAAVAANAAAQLQTGGT